MLCNPMCSKITAELFLSLMEPYKRVQCVAAVRVLCCRDSVGTPWDSGN